MVTLNARMASRSTQKRKAWSFSVPVGGKIQWYALCFWCEIRRISLHVDLNIESSCLVIQSRCSAYLSRCVSILL